MPASMQKRWGWRLWRGALVIYLVLLLVLSALQAQLIFPGSMTQGQSDAVVLETPGTEVALVDSAQGQLALRFGEPIPTPAQDDNTPRPTLMFFYGNAMCMADAVPLADDFRRRGCNVILIDYAGYGMSGGKPGEIGVYTAAATAYEFAIHRRNIDPATIVPIGLSLGNGAAIDIASKKPVGGLVLLSPFTSMTELAQQAMPIFPTSLILKHHFRNQEKLPNVRCPIFIAHGLRDSIIPVEMSDRLARLAGDRVKVNLRLNADHNDLLDIGGAALIDQICDFADSCVAPRP